MTGKDLKRRTTGSMFQTNHDHIADIKRNQALSMNQTNKNLEGISSPVHADHNIQGMINKNIMVPIMA
jgi:hypothetical protein